MKISFLDKADSSVKPVPIQNKIVADDMNEIKVVVNQNDDNTGVLSSLLTTIKTSIVGAINELVPLISANTSKVSAAGSVTTHNDVADAGSGEIITVTERDKLNRIDEVVYVGASRNNDLLDFNKLVLLGNNVVYTYSSIFSGSYSGNIRCVDAGSYSCTISFNPALIGEDGTANIPDITLNAGEWCNVTKVNDGSAFQGRIIISKP